MEIIFKLNKYIHRVYLQTKQIYSWSPSSNKTNIYMESIFKLNRYIHGVHLQTKQIYTWTIEYQGTQTKLKVSKDDFSS